MSRNFQSDYLRILEVVRFGKHKLILSQKGVYTRPNPASSKYETRIIR